MAMSDDVLTQEIDRNFDYFQSRFKDLMATHSGAFVLLRHQRVVGFFDRIEDAAREAQTRFSDRIYSIQVVEPEPVDLGFVTRA
jgi:hypothetical protein